MLWFGLKPGVCALGVLALPAGVPRTNSVSPTAKSVEQSRKVARYNVMDFLGPVIHHFLMVSRPLGSAHECGNKQQSGLTSGMVQAVEVRPGVEVLA